MILIVDEAEPRIRRVIMSTNTLIVQPQNLDDSQSIFHEKYSYLMHTHILNLFRTLTYATQNECMHQDSELKPDMSVATGTTTSIQVTTRQSTD